MKTKKSLFQLIMMLFLTFFAQLLILVKASKTASIFGVSIEMDIYNFINSIATFIFSFLGAGVTTILIPVFSKRHNDNESINSFITILYGIAFILMAILIMNSKFVFSHLSNYSNEHLVLASQMIGIIMLSQFINSLNCIYISYLQCKNVFNIPKIVSIFMTAIITVLVFVTDCLTVYTYAIYILIFVFIESLILFVYAYSKSFRFIPCLDINNKNFRKMMKTFFPTLWGSGVYQFTLITDSLISNSLGEGNISILSYSNTISGMLNTIICANVVSYIYPRIASESDDDKCKNKLFKYLVFFSFLMCVLLIAFVSGGHETIRLLFERGMFTRYATNSVYICVCIYLAGYPLNVMRDLMYRYFYSKGNTKSTFYNGLSASALNIIISIVLSKYMGLYGVVLGTTITSLFSLITIFIRFKINYYENNSFLPLIKELLKLLTATVSSIFVCVILKQILLLEIPLVSSIIIAIIGIAIFVLLLFLMKSKYYMIEL